MHYFDNTECVRLLQNNPGGLIRIIGNQARRSHKRTDHMMVEAFGKRWGYHSSFKVGAIDRSGYPHVHRQPLQRSRDLFLRLHGRGGRRVVALETAWSGRETSSCARMGTVEV